MTGEKKHMLCGVNPRWKGHVLGILASAHELCNVHDQPTMAKNLIRDLLQGEDVEELKAIAKHEGMVITEWHK